MSTTSGHCPPQIIASEDECDGFWQQNDYKVVPHARALLSPVPFSILRPPGCNSHKQPIPLVPACMICGFPVSWRPRASHHTRDKQAFTPGQDPNTVDWSTAPAMQEFPVNSIMTSPAT